MDKKLQIFISSTYQDLIEERQSAIEAILDAGHIPAGMELFKAGKSQMQTIRKWMDDSNIYILILGGRYGTIEEESGLSYTELEYTYALSQNMPVFAIILEDDFLSAKAASSGKDAIYEKTNIDKYHIFKKKVESNIVKYAKNNEHIQSIIHSQINAMIHDPDYKDKLVGWRRANQLPETFHGITTDTLHNYIKAMVSELFYRNTNIANTPFTATLTDQLFKIEDPQAMLEYSHITVDLELLDDQHNVKVTTATNNKFSFIKNKERYFGLYVAATKQQADSFKVETVQINSIDYTSQISLSVTNIPNRGQFTHIIKSDFVPPALPSCDLYYVTSYICPALDFFQARKLSYPCGNFMISVTLKNDIKHLYSIICSPFSSFSKLQYDDFKASQIHSFNNCTMNLPSWSPPGSGYAVTLKNKSAENHV